MIFGIASPFQPFVFQFVQERCGFFLRKILVQQLYNLVIVYTYGAKLAVKRSQSHIKINCSFVNFNRFHFLTKQQGNNKLCFIGHSRCFKSDKSLAFSSSVRRKTWRWMLGSVLALRPPLFCFCYCSRSSLIHFKSTQNADFGRRF